MVRARILKFYVKLQHEEKRTHIISFSPFGILLAELFPFFDLGFWRQMVGTLYEQLLIQFYTDQSESLKAFFVMVRP